MTRHGSSDVTSWSYLNEGDEERRAELLLEDDAVVGALVAAGDEGGEEDEGEARVGDVLERKLAELLKNARLLPRLNHILQERSRLYCTCICMESDATEICHVMMSIQV